jgi:hypothetical protein
MNSAPAGPGATVYIDNPRQVTSQQPGSQHHRSGAWRKRSRPHSGLTVPGVQHAPASECSSESEDPSDTDSARPGRPVLVVVLPGS